MLPTVGQPTPHLTEPALVSWTWPRRRKQRSRYSFLFDFGVHAATLDALIVVQNIEIAEHRWVAPPIALPMLNPGLAERLAAWQLGARYIEQEPFDLALAPGRLTKSAH